MSNFDHAARRYKAEAEFAISTAKYLELPEHLLERIHDYYDFMQTAAHPGTEGMAHLKKLPKKLYQGIALHMHGPALDAVPLLRGLEEAFLTELAVRVSAHILLPDEAVFFEGEARKTQHPPEYPIRDAKIPVNLTVSSRSFPSARDDR